MICVVGAGLSIDAGVPGIAGLQQRVNRKFRGHPRHGAAYRIALQQMEAGAQADGIGEDEFIRLSQEVEARWESERRTGGH